VAGDQGALQLGQHGGFEADDAGPWVAALAQRGEQVVTDFGLDAPLPVAGRAQRAEGAGKISGCIVKYWHGSTLRRHAAVRRRAV
jgi:hypothetical protein